MRDLRDEAGVVSLEREYSRTSRGGGVRHPIENRFARLALWVVAPILYWAAHQLVPDSTQYVMAIAATTALLIAGGLGALGNIAGGAIAGGGGASFSDADRAAIRAPTTGGALDRLLTAEQLLRLGASPEVIGEELILRQIEAGGTPAGRRVVTARLAEIRSQLAAGNTAAAERMLNIVNFDLGKSLQNSGGAAAQASIVDGQLQFTFNDPLIDSVLDTARQFGGDIAANRAQAIAGLASSAATGPQDAQALIDRRFDKQREELFQQANTLGFNPAGPLEDLNERQAIGGQLDAVNLANQLLLGQINTTNAALDPSGALGLLALQNQSGANSSQIANAQGTAFQQINAGQQGAIGQGLAGGLGSLGSAFTLQALLNANQPGTGGGPGQDNDPDSGFFFP